MAYSVILTLLQLMLLTIKSNAFKDHLNSHDKKDHDRDSNYKGCFSLPNNYNDMLDKSSIGMNLPLCRCNCAKRKKHFAGLRNQECYCLADLPHDKMSDCTNQCIDAACAWKGGQNSIAIYDKEKNAGIIICKDDINLLSPTTALITANPCPTGFFQFQSFCYYFETSDKFDRGGAQRLCETRQSDLATIESAEELNFIHNAIMSIPHETSLFYIGGYFSSNISSWTWSNGKPYRSTLFLLTNLNAVYASESCLVYNRLTNNFLGQECNNDGYGAICKYNPDFLGFYPVLPDKPRISFASDWMSVSACIQLCLDPNQSQTIQVLNKICNCYSVDQLADNNWNQNIFNCVEPIFCPGNSGQICGCDFLNAAVYTVDYNTTALYKDCQELYNNGIRVNGVYSFLTNINSFCYFQNEWSKCSNISSGAYISYRNRCFRIVAADMTYETADQAQAMCNKDASTLAMQADDDFLRFYQALIQSLSIEPTRQHWIESTDGNGFATIESDKILNFEANELKEIKYNPYICQHGYEGCYKLPEDANFIYTFSSPHMQLRYCMSVCRGQIEFYQYVGLSGEACYCMNENQFEISEMCNISCPGNSTQTCGGYHSVSVYNKGFYEGPMKSCQDYYNMSFYPPAGQPITFESSSGKPVSCSLENMFPPFPSIGDCPEGFVQYRNSCIYFETEIKSSANNGQRFCQTLQADLLSIKHIKEYLFIEDTIRRSNYFNTLHHYYTGGYFSPQTYSWIWRNGEKIQPYLIKNFNLNSKHSSEKCLTHNLINDTLSVSNCTRRFGVICKHNPQFLGFNWPNLFNSPTNYVSDQMSITLCSQLCRNASHTQIIQVLDNICKCHLNSYQFKFFGNHFACSKPKFCSGNSAQICGCDDNAAFYIVDISIDPMYQSCTDLYNSGIRVNGNYIFSSNKNVLKRLFCHFSDEQMNRTHVSVYYKKQCSTIDINDSKYKIVKSISNINGFSNMNGPSDKNEFSNINEFSNEYVLLYLNQVVSKYGVDISRSYWIDEPANDASDKRGGKRCAVIIFGKIHSINRCDFKKKLSLCSYGKYTF